MENYAGYMAHTDYHVGRLIDSLEGRRASSTTRSSSTSSATTARAPRAGWKARSASWRACSASSSAWRARSIGSTRSAGRPASRTFRSAGPGRWTRRSSGPSRSRSHFGGTRNPLVVHWPKGIKAKGELRDAVPPRDRRGADDSRGVPRPGAEGRRRHRAEADRGRLDALQLRRREGARAAARRSTSRCSATGRSTTTAGWRAAASACPGTPTAAAATSSTAPWELYNLDEDFSEANDLAPSESREAQGAAGQVPGGGQEVRRASARSALRRADGSEAARSAASRRRPGRTSATTSGCRSRSGRSSSRAATRSRRS